MGDSIMYELKFDFVVDKETNRIVWLEDVVKLLNNYEELKKQVEAMPPKIKELWID